MNLKKIDTFLETLYEKKKVTNFFEFIFFINVVLKFS